jgi:hypothetical protein
VLAPDLARRVATLAECVNEDAWLVHRGRFVTLTFLLELAATPYYVAIDRGRVAALDSGPALMRAWRFAVRGQAEAWRQFWQPMPPPHHHDIFALAKRGDFRIEGDLQPLMANLFYFKDVLAAPRQRSAA